jgi:hypothetical protein
MSAFFSVVEPLQPSKPTAGFWITVALVAVLVAYPLSFGPACWIVSRINDDEQYFQALYWPIGAMALQADSVERLVRWYGELAIPDEVAQRVYATPDGYSQLVLQTLDQR